MTDKLLDVANLKISFPSDHGLIPVVKSISFEVGREIVALVGESGSGKSMTGRAIMGLLPPRAQVTADRLSFETHDLRQMKPAGWRKIRGNGLGLILQDPKYSLNPALRIGQQVEETLLLHTSLNAKERKIKALSMLEKVGLTDAERVYRSYPSELSGGMGQRVMIASMLINAPRLLIADEATSALDHDLQIQVLELLQSLTREMGMGLLLISHDLQQVARFADRVLVMRNGEIIDRLAAADLSKSQNAYTSALWNARPSAATYGTRLPVLEREGVSP